MKTTRKGRKSRPSIPETRAPALRLPPQPPPVRRRISAAPFHIRVGVSQQDCAACFAGCARLPSPLRAVCVGLCKEVCRN